MTLWVTMVNCILAAPSQSPLPSLDSQTLRHSREEGQKDSVLSFKRHLLSESLIPQSLHSSTTENPEKDSERPSTYVNVHGGIFTNISSSLQGNSSLALHFPEYSDPDENSESPSTLQADPWQKSSYPVTSLHSRILNAFRSSYVQNILKDPEVPRTFSTKSPSKRASLGYGAWDIILTALDNDKKSKAYLGSQALGDKILQQGISETTGGDPTDTISLNTSKTTGNNSKILPWNRVNCFDNVFLSNSSDRAKNPDAWTTNPWNKAKEVVDVSVAKSWDRSKGPDGTSAPNTWDKPNDPEDVSSLNSWNKPKDSESPFLPIPWKKQKGFVRASNISAPSVFFPSLFPLFVSQGKDKTGQKEDFNDTFEKPSKFGHVVGTSVFVNFPRVTTEGGTGMPVSRGSYFADSGKATGGKLTVSGEEVTIGEEEITVGRERKLSQGNVTRNGGWITKEINTPWRDLLRGKGSVSSGSETLVSTDTGASGTRALEAGKVTEDANKTWERRWMSTKGDNSWKRASGGGESAGWGGVTGNSVRVAGQPCRKRCPPEQWSGRNEEWLSEGGMLGGERWVTGGSVGMTGSPCMGKCLTAVNEKIFKGGVSGVGVGTVRESKIVDDEPCGIKCPVGMGLEVLESVSSGEKGWVTEDKHGMGDRPCVGICIGVEYEYSTKRLSEKGQGGSWRKWEKKGGVARDHKEGERKLHRNTSLPFGQKYNEFLIIGGRGSRSYTLPYLLLRPPVTFLGSTGGKKITCMKEKTGKGIKGEQGGRGWSQTTLTEEQGKNIGFGRKREGSRSKTEAECKGYMKTQGTGAWFGPETWSTGRETRAKSSVLEVGIGGLGYRRERVGVGSGVMEVRVTDSGYKRGWTIVKKGELGEAVTSSKGERTGNKHKGETGSTKVRKVHNIRDEDRMFTSKRDDGIYSYFQKVKPQTKILEGYGRPTVPPFWSVVSGALGFIPSTPHVGARYKEDQSNVEEEHNKTTAVNTNNGLGQKLVTNIYGENYKYSWG